MGQAEIQRAESDSEGMKGRTKLKFLTSGADDVTSGGIYDNIQ